MNEGIEGEIIKKRIPLDGILQVLTFYFGSKLRVTMSTCDVGLGVGSGDFRQWSHVVYDICVNGCNYYLIQHIIFIFDSLTLYIIFQLNNLSLAIKISTKSNNHSV